jgi:hypothetical protein
MSKETWGKSWEEEEEKDINDVCHVAEAKSDERNTTGSKLTPDDDEIVTALQKYFFEDESLAEHFETFIDHNSHVVDLDSDEYKLQYTEIFNNYKRLFEDMMEAFINSSLHCSIQDVYLALKNKVDLDENSSDAFFAQILVAVTDFDVFMMMMRDSATKVRNEKIHK